MSNKNHYKSRPSEILRYRRRQKVFDNFFNAMARAVLRKTDEEINYLYKKQKARKNVK